MSLEDDLKRFESHLEFMAKKGQDSRAFSYIYNLPKQYEGKRQYLILAYYDFRETYRKIEKKRC